MIANRLRLAASRVDAMTMRERVLIFASALVAVLLAWFQFVMLPVLETEKRAVEDIKTVRDRIDAADAAVRAQTAEFGVDTGASLAAQLEETQARAADIDALIAARAAQIVDPATMARVLEDLLASQKGLRLVRAHNLQAQRVPESDDDMPLFRHTLRLELEGPYLTVLSYLEKIEALPWRMYWQGIEIDASEFPRNRVRIDVSTLSFEEDWIGV